VIARTTKISCNGPELFFKGAEFEIPSVSVAFKKTLNMAPTEIIEFT